MKLAVKFILPTAIIIAVGFYLLFLKQPEETPPHPAEISNSEKQLRSAEQSQQASLSLRFDQSSAKLANDPLDRASFSEEMLIIDDPESTNQQVMRSLHSLLSTIKYLSPGRSYPSGLNVEIANSLLGLNSRKVGYLPADSLRLNKYGELIDTYGTPYWFHTSASNHLKVVSAGPDQTMHTADDIVFPNE